MQHAEILRAAGEALYGSRWKEPLARNLQRPDANAPGVDKRLMHHWLVGTPGRPVPDWAPAAAVDLLRNEVRRKAALERLADKLSRWTDIQ